MIDLSKSYATNDGKKVRLAFIEDGRVHGFLLDKNLPVDIKWSPWLWKEDTGYPFHGVLDKTGHYQDWVYEAQLKEVKPTKQISTTIYVLLDGRCKSGGEKSTMGEINDMFASFTVNVEVEEGSFDKVYFINQ